MSKNLVIGEAVPDFSAPATSELNFKLSDYKGKSNLVIYFYPKDSTPGCTTEGQDFRDLHEDFKHFNVWQLKKMYGKEYMGIVRSTFLIDKDGILRAQWDKVKVKGHAAEVLETVKAL